MLVDDKFIIILIPRCATTSFVATCQINNIPIKTGRSDVGGYENSISYVTKKFTHYHDNITFLTSKFGNDYPIIAVKRNKYDSFISMWKMILNILDVYHLKHELVKTLSKLKIDDILFFHRSEYSLLDTHSLLKLCKAFFTKNNIPYDLVLYQYLQLLYMPESSYHNFDKRIIWFDFNKLDELEKWVSDKLDMDFKLENINSSKNINCDIENDEYFKERFDYIFSRYEVIKENKTLI
jgi:hypothetical protein